MAIHLQEIRKVLLNYLFPINLIAKQKRAMRCIMCNPRGIKLRQFMARLQELNNILPKFLVSDEFRKVPQEE